MNKGYAVFNPLTNKFVAESDAIGLFEQANPFFYDDIETAHDVAFDPFGGGIKWKVVEVKWKIKTD